MLHLRRLFLCFALIGFVTPVSVASAQLDGKSMVKLLADLDARQRALGDYKATLYLEYKRKGEEDLVYQAVTYRRESEDKFVFLFLKPKASAGSGYLRLDKSMFLFNPTVGKWERRTERERIGGTDSTRQDFDVKDLGRDFVPEYVAKEKLGKFAVHHLKLKAKKDAKVGFPIVHVWLDVETNNILKQQDASASGKLLRTLYYPKWDKVARPGGKGNIDFPREVRIYDELKKGNQTIIVLQKVEMKKLPDNLFTKAWLESKSR